MFIYKHARKEMIRVFGSEADANLYVDFLAATSPNTTIQSNVTLALKTFQQYKTGEPFTGYPPVAAKQLQAAAEGREFSGPKVTSFRANLHGDASSVTVDRWIARAAGFKDKITAQQYRFIDHWISQVAREKGIEPRQLQAAIWTAIKESEQTTSNESFSFEEILKRAISGHTELKTISLAN